MSKRGGEVELDGLESKKRKKWVKKLPFNENYAYWFNSQAAEFIKAIRLGPNATDLEDGFVTTQRSYITKHSLSEDGSGRGEERDPVDGELRVGSYWTAEEKERFFQLLGRKSRHNLVDVARALGTKSLVEVEEYHDLLFQASKSKCLLNVGDIPAAQEMSEAFVDMENSQSYGLADYEVAKEAATMRVWRSRMNGASASATATKSADGAGASTSDSTESSGPVDVVVDNPSVMEELPEHAKVLKAEEFDREADNTQTLINAQELVLLAGQVFYNAYYDDTYGEYLDRRGLQFISREVIAALENHILWLTRSIVRECLTQGMQQKSVLADSDIVGQREVRLALEKFGLTTNKVDRQKYWRDLPERINLRVMKRTLPTRSEVATALSVRERGVSRKKNNDNLVDDIRSDSDSDSVLDGSGQYFSSDSDPDFESDGSDSRKTTSEYQDTNDYMEGDEGLSQTQRSQESSSQIEPHETTTAPHQDEPASSLASTQPVRQQALVFESDESSQLVLQPSSRERKRFRGLRLPTEQKELELCQRESEILDAQDMLKSKGEEHVLLTFLTTDFDSTSTDSVGDEINGLEDLETARSLMLKRRENADPKSKYNKHIKWQESLPVDGTDSESEVDSDFDSAPETMQTSGNDSESESQTAQDSITDHDLRIWFKSWDRSGYDIAAS